MEGKSDGTFDGQLDGGSFNGGLDGAFNFEAAGNQQSITFGRKVAGNLQSVIFDTLWKLPVISGGEEV